MAIWKYFAKEYFGSIKSHQFVPDSIARTMSQLCGKEMATYKTIQDYDHNGNVTGCFMYVDVDDSCIYDAYQTTINIANDLSEFGKPLAFFSGGKGFHLLFPTYIKHSKCHYIVRKIVEERTNGFDARVYTEKRLFRCEGSFNLKGGKYKVSVDLGEPLANIMDRADRWQGDGSEFNTFNCYSSDSPRELASYFTSADSEDNFVPSSNSFNFEHMFPCIKRMLNDGDIKSGKRHAVIYLLSKFMYSSGLTVDDSIGVFYNHPFFKSYDPYEFEKVARAVYNGRHNQYSCVGNSYDSAIMNEYCVSGCPVNMIKNVFR